MSELQVVFAKSATAKSKVQFASFNIAELTVAFDDDFAIEINGDAVDVEGVRYIIGYGLQQALADSYAAETTYAGAAPKFAKRLAAIMSGDMVFGAANRSSDPVVVEMNELIRTYIFELKRDSTKEAYADFRKRVGKGQFAKWFDQVVAQAGDTFRAKAEAIVATRAKGEEVVVTLD
jgi:hypothetical protein